MIERSYATRLVNDRREKVLVYELDGPLVELQPGQSFEVESRNPLTMYAAWSQVTWHEGGKVTFVTRSNFTPPDLGRWTILLLNKAGEEEAERRAVGGRSIILPRGIPVLIGLKLDDPLVRFKSMTIVRKRVMTKDPEHEGYCLHEWVTKDELEKRDASELKVLEKLLAEIRI